MNKQLNKYLSFLEQDPDNSKLLADIITLFLYDGETDKAKEYLNRLKDIDETSALALQGEIYNAEGHYQEAEAVYRQSLLKQDNKEHRFALAMTCFYQSKFLDAIEQLRPLASENNIDALLLRARCFHYLGQFEEAHDDLDRVLDLNLNESMAYSLKSLLLFDEGDVKMAQTMAERALQFNPPPYEARLVRLLTQNLPMEQQRQEAEAMLSIQQHDPRLWFMYGHILMQEMSFDEAMNALNQSLKLLPDYYDAQISLIMVYLLTDRANEALAISRQAVSQYPDEAETNGALALSLAVLGQKAEAEQVLIDSQAVEQDSILATMADILLLNKSNPLLAEEKFNRAFGEGMGPMQGLLQRLMLDKANHEGKLH